MGELSPVTLSSYGVGKLVSVLVSVADSLAPKPLLHTQLGMEGRVGIEPTPKFQGRRAFWPTAAPMPAAGGDAGTGAGLNLHPGIPLAKLLEALASGMSHKQLDILIGLSSMDGQEMEALNV